MSVPFQQSRPQAVVILGAGASAPFGVPTLRHLFQDPQARRHLQTDGVLAKTLQTIFWSPRGKDLESSHETLTVEEMLTVTGDYERNRGNIPDLLPDLTGFRRSLYVLIKRAVYDSKSTTGRHLNPVIEFARARFAHTTWASFNWDCIFESSLFYSSCSDWRGRTNPHVVIALKNWANPSSYPHYFLKLHGGVNWWFDEGGIVYLPFGSQPDLNDRWRQYERGTATGHPVLLEPSYYKYEDPVYKLLEPQWEVLIHKLVQADRVAILGYSLPEADSMARTALTIGFQSGRTDGRWIVVNQDSAICDRYRRFFGTRRLKTLAITLQEFSTNIAGHLELDQ